MYGVVEIAAASVPVLDRMTCPVRFVLATGDSLGSQDGEMEQGRTTLDSVLARNPNLKVSAKVASNHSKILRNDSPAVAQPYASSPLPAARGRLSTDGRRRTLARPSSAVSVP